MARDENDSSRSTEHRNAEHHESYSTNREPPAVSRSVITTGALIGIAALFEPELLVGMAVGAGIAMASNWLPDIVSGTVRPLVKTAVKAGYAAATMAREMASEAAESVQDIVAEARAENGTRQS